MIFQLHRWCFSAVLLLASPSVVTAQSAVDTLVRLPTVGVIGSTIRAATIGGVTQTWSERELAIRPINDVGELLSDAGVYVKSYGLGSLATSSARGGAAGHTLVLWNGLPVSSPMLGQLDLSLFPAAGFDAASFTRGGDGALWGSGAVGGVLSLRNVPNFSAPLTVGVSGRTGSFGWRERSAKVAFGGKKIAFSSLARRLTATNDFVYSPAPGVDDRRQRNAALRQSLVTQQLSWRPRPGRTLSAHAWFQESHRELPPALAQTRSLAFQDDRSRRLLLHYHDHVGALTWDARAAVFDEDLHFEDPVIQLSAPSGFTSLLAELTAARLSRGGRHKTLLGTTARGTRASAQGYGSSARRETRAALFASHRYATDRLNAQGSLRLATIDGSAVPVLPAIGATYALSSRTEVAAKISRNYRLPTLNDRFWLPGGQPNLLPESGWSQELTWRYTRVQAINGQRAGTADKWATNLSLTGFNRNLSDYILWYLPPEGRAWTAGNVSRVWSRGLEVRASATRGGKDWRAGLSLGYDYVRSTNQTNLERPKLSVGEQLWYVPTHQANARLEATWRDFSIHYRHQYTGPAAGVSATVAAFHTGDLRITHNYRWHGLDGKLLLDVRNAWNENYVVIERRPMPGRHFRLGLELNFTPFNPTR